MVAGDYDQAAFDDLPMHANDEPPLKAGTFEHGYEDDLADESVDTFLPMARSRHDTMRV